MDVPNWDEYFLSLCEVIKKRSKDPIKQVGSVLVSNNNKIISTGYNGLKRGSDDNIDWNDRELVHSLIIHAEMNSLLYADSKFDNTRLYSSLSPCKECLKLIACSGIKTIIYKEKHKDIISVEKICKFYNIELIQI